ncbi:hypothetical protein HYH03_001706 [Edaphochlamys debaryana]|uniref:Protein kinase domain-containing protein n=1 Tax=Edaphochlamys debaryana TaxID=47281 RepID=A0A836C5R2_9CHLO|nr:hypothetical protein HYH03_001706 [Edaphochlamys debaryana]|eukprot:KAG2500124.1 hypothetical protein HYH03_001706 [Edaphochlamys debaryana]
MAGLPLAVCALPPNYVRHQLMCAERTRSQKFLQAMDPGQPEDYHQYQAPEAQPYQSFGDGAFIVVRTPGPDDACVVADGALMDAEARGVVGIVARGLLEAFHSAGGDGEGAEWYGLHLEQVCMDYSAATGQAVPCALAQMLKMSGLFAWPGSDESEDPVVTFRDDLPGLYDMTPDELYERILSGDTLQAAAVGGLSEQGEEDEVGWAMQAGAGNAGYHPPGGQAWGPVDARPPPYYPPSPRPTLDPLECTLELTIGPNRRGRVVPLWPEPQAEARGGGSGSNSPAAAPGAATDEQLEPFLDFLPSGLREEVRRCAAGRLEEAASAGDAGGSCRSVPVLMDLWVDAGRDVRLAFSDGSKRTLEGVKVAMQAALSHLASRVLAMSGAAAAERQGAPREAAPGSSVHSAESGDGLGSCGGEDGVSGEGEAGQKRGRTRSGDCGDRPAKRQRDEAAAAAPVPVVSPAEVDRCFGSDNRCCPPGTLHRVSALRDPRSGRVVGLTYRVGRHLPGLAGPLADVLADLAGRGRAWRRGGDEEDLAGSLLLLGRPGSGKTTLLRDIAAHLDSLGLSVVVVDTSNEIAGGDDPPHACIGSARRLMVGRRSQLAAKMIEAVQNHGTEVVIVDEIADSEEVAAARTIAARGVMLVATAHGTGLHSLMANNQLNGLVGGLQPVILGDAKAAETNNGSKTRTERRGQPVFRTMVEVLGGGRLLLRPDVASSVDAILGARPSSQQWQQGLQCSPAGAHALPAGAAPRLSHGQAGRSVGQSAHLAAQRQLGPGGGRRQRAPYHTQYGNRDTYGPDGQGPSQEPPVLQRPGSLLLHRSARPQEAGGSAGGAAEPLPPLEQLRWTEAEEEARSARGGAGGGQRGAGGRPAVLTGATALEGEPASAADSTKPGWTGGTILDWSTFWDTPALQVQPGSSLRLSNLTLLLPPLPEAAQAAPRSLLAHLVAAAGGEGGGSLVLRGVTLVAASCQDLYAFATRVCDVSTWGHTTTLTVEGGVVHYKAGGSMALGLLSGSSTPAAAELEDVRVTCAPVEGGWSAIAEALLSGSAPSPLSPWPCLALAVANWTELRAVLTPEALAASSVAVLVTLTGDVDMTGSGDNAETADWQPPMIPLGLVIALYGRPEAGPQGLPATRFHAAFRRFISAQTGRPSYGRLLMHDLTLTGLPYPAAPFTSDQFLAGWVWAVGVTTPGFPLGFGGALDSFMSAFECVRCAIVLPDAEVQWWSAEAATGSAFGYKLEPFPPTPPPSAPSPMPPMPLAVAPLRLRSMAESCCAPGRSFADVTLVPASVFEGRGGGGPERASTGWRVDAAAAPVWPLAADLGWEEAARVPTGGGLVMAASEAGNPALLASLCNQGAALFVNGGTEPLSPGEPGMRGVTLSNFVATDVTAFLEYDNSGPEGGGCTFGGPLVDSGAGRVFWDLKGRDYRLILNPSGGTLRLRSLVLMGLAPSPPGWMAPLMGLAAPLWYFDFDRLQPGAPRLYVRNVTLLVPRAELELMKRMLATAGVLPDGGPLERAPWRINGRDHVPVLSDPILGGRRRLVQQAGGEDAALSAAAAAAQHRCASSLLRSYAAASQVAWYTNDTIHFARTLHLGWIGEEVVMTSALPYDAPSGYTPGTEPTGPANGRGLGAELEAPCSPAEPAPPSPPQPGSTAAQPGPSTPTPWTSASSPAPAAPSAPAVATAPGGDEAGNATDKGNQLEGGRTSFPRQGGSAAPQPSLPLASAPRVEGDGGGSSAPSGSQQRAPWMIAVAVACAVAGASASVLVMLIIYRRRRTHRSLELGKRPTKSHPGSDDRSCGPRDRGVLSTIQSGSALPIGLSALGSHAYGSPSGNAVDAAHGFGGAWQRPISSRQHSLPLGPLLRTRFRRSSGMEAAIHALRASIDGPPSGDRSSGGGGSKHAEANSVTLTGLLGRGGHGVVYAGTWRGLAVAVKVVVMADEDEDEAGPPPAYARESADKAMTGEHGSGAAGGAQGTLQEAPLTQATARARRGAVLEAAISSTLDHPNLVRAYAYEVRSLQPLSSRKRSDGPGGRSSIDSGAQQLLIVMELCEKGSLKDAMATGSVRSITAAAAAAPSAPEASAAEAVASAAATALALALDVACGLAHLHAQGIVHGDLSPGNILLASRESGDKHAVVSSWSQGTSGELSGAQYAEAAAQSAALAGGWASPVSAKLCDFGLAVRLRPGASHTSGALGGTPAYAAPELAASGRLGRASDVFSLGVVMAELAAGPSAAAALRDAAYAPSSLAPAPPPPVPALLVGNSGEALWELAARCTAAEPRARPAVWQVLDSLMHAIRTGPDRTAA